MKFRTAISLLVLCPVLVGCCHSNGSTTGPSTPGFLGPTDFEGSYDTQQKKAIYTGGQTLFDGSILFTNLDRSTIENILPADVQLAANSSASPNKHPIVVLFGMQENLKWIFPWGQSVNAGHDYHEVMLLIPFVQKTDGTKWHNFVVRMYLDWQWGVNAGNLFFGYMKEFSDFTILSNPQVLPNFAYNVVKNATPLFGANSTNSGEWLDNEDAQSNLANFQTMQQIFTMPMLGTMDGPDKKHDICTFFKWNWGETQSRSEVLQYQFLQNFVPNMNSWVSLGLLGSEPMGGFGVKQLQWRLTLAHKCKF